jgi:hypothetical protein
MVDKRNREGFLLFNTLKVIHKSFTNYTQVVDKLFTIFNQAFRIRSVSVFFVMFCKPNIKFLLSDYKCDCQRVVLLFNPVKMLLMKKISKKEIKNTVEGAMTQALSEFEISAPSKKTKKAITKATKKVSDEVKRELKKQKKKALKATKKSDQPKKKKRKPELINTEAA